MILHSDATTRRSSRFVLASLTLVAACGGSDAKGTTAPIDGGVSSTDDSAAAAASLPDASDSATTSSWTPPAAPPAGSPVAVHGQLQVAGTQLNDQAGNPVQLKGVSSMWLNWESKPFAESKTGLQYARDHWKLSLIRASMGIDASNGYLTSTVNRAAMQAKVEAIVQNAIDLGVYVLIDWHTEKAVSQQADSITFFTAMAQKYGSYPNVIYETYNEPHGFTWAQIKPYHVALVAAIRAQDPDNLVVMGTPNYSQDVDIAAGDPVSGTNLLYTLHFYACTHTQWLRNKADAAIAKGLALFVTEFGATPSDGGVVKSGDNFVCEGETNTWFAWMAQNSISGAAWKFEQCTDSSCILTSSAPADGPWPDSVLTSDANGTPVDGGVQGGGHGLFVVNWIRE